MELTRVNRDINGNTRYVVHFSDLLPRGYPGTVLEQLAEALNRARTIGGKKYRGKDYGGGVVFQSVNTDDLIKHIKEVAK